MLERYRKQQADVEERQRRFDAIVDPPPPKYISVTLCHTENHRNILLSLELCTGQNFLLDARNNRRSEGKRKICDRSAGDCASDYCCEMEPIVAKWSRLLVGIQSSAILNPPADMGVAHPPGCALYKYYSASR